MHAVVRGGPRTFDFSKFITAYARARGDLPQAALIAEREPGAGNATVLLRTIVAAGSTSDASFASPFAVSSAARELIELLRPQTVIGRITTGFRKVPFELPVARQTVGAAAGWVGELQPTPITAPGYDTIMKLAPTKVQAASVISNELASSSDPSAEEAVRRDVTAAVALAIDQQFLDPTVTAAANVRPASITHGAPSIASSGGTAAQVWSDIGKLLDLMARAGGLFLAPYFICSPLLAIKLAALRATSGDAAFTDVTARGGSIAGIPLLTSAAMGVDTGDDTSLVLLDASNILLADEGEITIDISTQGTCEMSNTPTNPPTSSTIFVSLWQENLIAIRATRRINWVAANTAAAAILTGVPL